MDPKLIMQVIVELALGNVALTLLLYYLIPKSIRIQWEDGQIAGKIKCGMSLLVIIALCAIFFFAKLFPVDQNWAMIMGQAFIAWLGGAGIYDKSIGKFIEKK